MNDKKNIDRLFQEKFKDFEAAPNDAVWNRISESLPNKKKNRRVIALWWQIGGVAAVLALLLTVGVSVLNSGENNNQDLPIVNTDKVDTENNQNEDGFNKVTESKQNELKTDVDDLQFVNSDSEKKSTSEELQQSLSTKDNVSNPLTTSKKYDQKSNAIANTTNESQEKTALQKHNNLTTGSNKERRTKIIANTETAKSHLKNSKNSELVKDSELKSTIKKTVEENKTAVSENTSSDKLNSQTNKTDAKQIEKELIEDVKKQSIEHAIAENTNTTKDLTEKEESNQSRWSIAPNVAPVYYSSLGQGSSLDQQFSENSKTSDINMSYGITGSYAISKKIKIRAGINRVNLNQSTSNVYAFTGAETQARGVDAQFGNITFKEGAPTVSLISSDVINKLSAPEAFNTRIAGEVDQRFGFIEVPLELEYRLLDTKFGINVIGGFSTFFLNENEIYADVDGVSTRIGEANNINDTSFSANLGLGMDYSLSKQWNINLEPQFKYQINTFNNTSGDLRPFFIGVYTGLSFKF